jgi:hypothetical protein
VVGGICVASSRPAPEAAGRSASKDVMCLICMYGGACDFDVRTAQELMSCARSSTSRLCSL